MRLLFYVASNQLTSWSSVLLEKHTVTQQVKKFPAFCTFISHKAWKRREFLRTWYWLRSLLFWDITQRRVEVR